LYALPTFFIHPICPAHFIILNMTIISVFAKDSKLWRSSFCNSLQLPLNSSPLMPEFSLQHCY
jgi:hypothetical protein